MQSTLLRVKESRWTGRLLSPIMLLVLVIVFSISTGGRFGSLTNLRMVLEQALVVATVATGAVFIYATGNVNISMGAATALAATIAANAYLASESVLVMLLVALVVGAITLAIMALLSTWLHVRVLYITVVMMTLLSSIQKGIMGASTIQLPYAMTSGLKNAYVPYIVFFGFLIFCTVLFHFTSLGRKLRYLGINPECAELTGFKLNKYLFIGFVIAGIGVGFGALLTIIRSGSITNDTCASLNMDCMLAIVLGGMSCFGGNRSMTYSGIIGAVMVTVMNNGLLMIGVSSTVLQGIRGVIFIILVCASQKRPQGLPDRDG